MHQIFPKPPCNKSNVIPVNVEHSVHKTYRRIQKSGSAEFYTMNKVMDILYICQKLVQHQDLVLRGFLFLQRWHYLPHSSHTPCTDSLDWIKPHSLVRMICLLLIQSNISFYAQHDHILLYSGTQTSSVFFFIFSLAAHAYSTSGLDSIGSLCLMLRNVMSPSWGEV